MARSLAKLEVMVAVVLLAVATILVTLSTFPPKEAGWPGFLAATGIFLLGPIGGWIVAAQQGALPGALELLLPSNVITILPAWRYFSGRARWPRVWLAAATFFWFCSGYLFTIAIWI